MILTPEMKEALNKTVEEWAEKFKKQRYDSLSRREKSASGDLSRSFRYQLHKHTEGEVSDLLFYFMTHGRWLDMKNLQMGNPSKEYIDNVVAWMEQKGITNDLILGWHSKNGDRVVPIDIERRIAWGIIISRARKAKRWRWYNKQKQGALTELNTRVMLALTQPLLTDVKALLTPLESKQSRAFNKARMR